MPHHTLYQQIALRYIDAASTLELTIPEVSTFATYHAFESIACAWIRSRNRKVPRKHADKLLRFLALSSGQGFRRGAAVLEVELNAQRNRMLYPTLNGLGHYVLPETLITGAQATKLRHRVDGLINQIIPHL